jgi:NADH-quinone oxidoreductase subunit C
MNAVAGLLAAARRQPGAVVGVEEFRGETTLTVAADRLLETLEALAAEGPLVLTDLTALDRHPQQPRFDVVYLLTGYAPPVRLRVKVRLPGDAPVVPTVTGVWPAADWLEREVYDLFGIRFDGHPNLTRILMPDDWEGYPLRKDVPLTEEPVEFVAHVPKVPSAIVPKSPPGS